MACDVTQGKIDLACKDTVSGMKAIYIANYGSFEYTAGTGPDASTQTIVDIDGATGAEFFKYEVKNSGNTLAQDGASNRDNGTTFFTQVLTVILTKLSPAMEHQIKVMAWGRPQIIVEANSGEFILIGREHGCEVSTRSEIQGTMDSLNGYTITATAMERLPLFYLDSAAKTFVLANVSTDNIE